MNHLKSSIALHMANTTRCVPSTVFIDRPCISLLFLHMFVKKKKSEIFHLNILDVMEAIYVHIFTNFLPHRILYLLFVGKKLCRYSQVEPQKTFPNTRSKLKSRSVHRIPKAYILLCMLQFAHWTSCQ